MLGDPDTGEESDTTGGTPSPERSPKGSTAQEKEPSSHPVASDESRREVAPTPQQESSDTSLFVNEECDDSLEGFDLGEPTSEEEDLEPNATDELQMQFAGRKKDFLKHQKEDPSMKECWKKAEAYPEFQVKDKLLYRVTKHGGNQLLLPKSYRNMILKMSHSSVWAGHLGRKKTGQRLLKNFFWPGVYGEIAAMCRSCPECQKGYKSVHSKYPLPRIDTPFNRVAMDVVGPVERTYKYMFTYMDYSSRYAEAIPLRKVNSESILKALMGIFSRLGIPREILSDNGANLTSKLVEEVFTLLDIGHIKTSPYHPQTDGMVERFHKTLKEMLRKVKPKYGNQWDRALPVVLFSLRSTPNETTGFSPLELIE